MCRVGGGCLRVWDLPPVLLITPPHQHINPDSPVEIFDTDDIDDILSKFIYLGDDRNIVRIFVAGREVVGKSPL